MDFDVLRLLVARMPPITNALFALLSECDPDELAETDPELLDALTGALHATANVHHVLTERGLRIAEDPDIRAALEDRDEEMADRIKTMMAEGSPLKDARSVTIANEELDLAQKLVMRAIDEFYPTKWFDWDEVADLRDRLYNAGAITPPSETSFDQEYPPPWRPESRYAVNHDGRSENDDTAS